MNFLHSQRFLSIFVTLSGLRPYRYDAKANGMRSVVLLQIYSLIFEVSLQICGLVEIIGKTTPSNQEILKHQSVLQNVVRIFEMLSSNLFIAIVLINGFANRQLHLKIGDQVLKIEEMLASNSVPCNLTSFGRRTTLVVFGILFQYLIALNIVYRQIFEDPSYYIYMFHVLIMIFCCLFIKNFVVYVKLTAVALGVEIQKRFKNRPMNRESANALLQLEELHGEISKLLPMISNGFGLAFFGAHCFNITETVLQFFTMFLTVSVGAIDWATIVYNTCNIVWMVPLWLLQMSLGNVASDAEDELQNVTYLIVDLSKSHQTELIEIIGQQSLLENACTDRRLSVFGFYVLSKVTAFQTFTSVVTYALILIQFKQLEDDTKAEI